MHIVCVAPNQAQPSSVEGPFLPIQPGAVLKGRNHFDVKKIQRIYMLQFCNKMKSFLRNGMVVTNITDIAVQHGTN